MGKIRLKKRMNKKAQIGTTITWFAATIIIFFIMLLFVSATAALAAKKLVIDKNKIESEEIGSKLDVQREFVFFLNNPVEFEGEKIMLKDLIVLMTAPYLEESIFNELKKTRISSVNEIYLVKDGLSQEFFISAGISREKEEEFFQLVQDSLDNDCIYYTLKLPFGFVYRLGGSKGYGSNVMASTREHDIAVHLEKFEINYKGHVIKIEFRGRYIC